MADTNTPTSTPIVSGDHQLQVLNQKRQECETKIAASVKPEPSEGGEWCSAAWDGILCWGRVPAGQMSSQPCPGYVVGSQTQAEATRRCLDDGRWFVHNNTGLTWTNYSMCFPEIDATVVMDFPGATNVTVMENYVPVVKAIARAGYAVSLASLVVAFCILAAVKKLRCPRNILHMHLFLSFIMRAFMAILKDSLFVMGLGLSSDIVVKTEGTYFSSEDEENWECKLITSLWQYFIMANYSWILMEGLYLHNLIFLALFSDTSSISLYVMLGWGMPAVCVLSWVACRVVLEDTLCWTTNQSASLFLLIRVPTTLSIILNFILFVNIVRVLLLKLRSTVCEETRRFRRWAKSTLVLVPLFGVHYTVFLGLSYSMGIDPDVELAWLFCDQLFASFQGFFVAVLYCFMNGEVRTELSKKWHRAYPWGGRNESGRLSASGRSLSIIPGRHNQPRASCYSSTSCTSLSIGGAPSFGSSWLLNKRRSGSVQDAPRPGHTFGELGTVSYYSNLSEMGSRIANGQDRRWSKSDYNVMGSVL